MDMNTNRYEKPVQATSRRSDRSSADGVTIEQCQAYKPEPSQYQGTAVSTEETGTDGTTNVQGRSVDR